MGWLLLFIRWHKIRVWRWKRDGEELGIKSAIREVNCHAKIQGKCTIN